MTFFARFHKVALVFLVAFLDGTQAQQQEDSSSECGLWLGPSPIKEQEEHGFGFGMFTGKHIQKGQVMHAELLVPLFDYEDEHHPPLREYLWSAEPLRKIVLESLDGTMIFVPGLASITPCTSNNFNLEQVHNLQFNDWNVRHGRQNATTGAFSYYNNTMFTAIRDILPGEELVVECSDDDFDPSKYPKQVFDNANELMICLDDRVEERPSPIHGKGLFAKKNLKANDILTSSPMTPIDRKELEMEDDRKQLLLNYCYGHPDSSLLWLPHGSSVNAINHYATTFGSSNTANTQVPNAKVQWRQQHDPTLARRQQFHHPELLLAVSEEVAIVHGKGLVMDVVAIKDIAKNEEIVLDYGAAWETAFKEHLKRWEEINNYDYISAREFNQRHANDNVLTITEQHKHPYPHHLQTACYYQEDWIEDETAVDDLVTFESWNNQSPPRVCILPCVILEREEQPQEQDGDTKTTTTTLYTAKLADTYQDNVSIDWDCHIYRKFEYIYEDIPREGITFVEKPYHSDVWHRLAFRQAIGASEEMYPNVWRKRNFRRRSSESSASSEDQESFKRKTVKSKQAALEGIRLKSEPSARMDL